MSIITSDSNNGSFVSKRSESWESEAPDLIWFKPIPVKGPKEFLFSEIEKPDPRADPKPLPIPGPPTLLGS